MKPQDFVAILLTVGILLMLMSGTNLRCFVLDCIEIPFQPVNDAVANFWKDIVLVILGALSGYISGKDSNGGRD